MGIRTVYVVSWISLVVKFNLMWLTCVLHLVVDQWIGSLKPPRVMAHRASLAEDPEAAFFVEAEVLTFQRILTVLNVLATGGAIPVVAKDIPEVRGVVYRYTPLLGCEFSV